MIQQPWNNTVFSQLSLYLSETKKKCILLSHSFWLKTFSHPCWTKLKLSPIKKKGVLYFAILFFSLWKAWPQLNVIWFTWVDSKSKTIMGWHSFCSLLLFSYHHFSAILWLLIPSITLCFSNRYLLWNWKPGKFFDDNIRALQSLTGKLQGVITTQGDPCSHYREWVYRVQLFSVLVTFLSLFY